MRLVGLLLGLAPTALTLAVGGWRQHQWNLSYKSALAASGEQRLTLLKQAVAQAGSPFVAPEHLIESLQAQAREQERLGLVATARDALQSATQVNSPVFQLSAPRAGIFRDLARLDHLAHDRDAEVRDREMLNFLDAKLQVDRDTQARDTLDLAEAMAAQGRQPEQAASLYEQAHALWRRVPTSDQMVRATLGLARLTLNRGELKKADHLYTQALEEGLDGLGEAPARCDALRQALLAKRLLGLEAEAHELHTKYGETCPSDDRTDGALTRAERRIADAREALSRNQSANTEEVARAELTLLSYSTSNESDFNEPVGDAWYALAQYYASVELPHEALAALNEALARPRSKPAPWHSEALRLRGNCRLRALGTAGASQAVDDLRAAREDYLESGPTGGFLDLSLELAEAQLKASDREGAASTLTEVARPIRDGRDPARTKHLEALMARAGIRSTP